MQLSLPSWLRFGSRILARVPILRFVACEKALRLDNNVRDAWPSNCATTWITYRSSRGLLSQHFSAIAAAGPIVGPILAGVMFGWLPALIWILVGSIFIGGVHDFTALVASIRHRADRSPRSCAST